jgi:hypothetical protein
MQTNQFFRNRTWKIRILIIVAVLFQFPVTGFSQVKKVWALGDGEKVFRNDDNHPDREYLKTTEKTRI